MTRAGLNPETIVQQLNQSPDTLPDLLGKIRKDSMDGQALVLFLDQMEELFTPQDGGKTRQFLTALYRVAQEKTVWVVTTMRSDHLHHCYGQTEMRTVLASKGHYPLGSIEPYMVEDLITQPARCAGLRLSCDLARRIVHEAGSDPGNLPILAFLLNQMFEKRRDHELTTEGYLALGKVTGAVKQHVEQVEADLEKAEGSKTVALLPQLFQSLVTVNAEGVPTRRRPLRSAFPSEMNRLLTVLIGARLLHTEGQDEGGTVSISHEKLFDAWPLLKSYVEANKKQLIDQRLLESRAQKWEELGKPWFDGLASGREYQDFRRSMTAATPLTKAYLEASARARWLQVGAIGVVLLVVTGTATWLWSTGLTVEQAVLRAQSQVMSIHLAPVMETIPAGTFRQGGDGSSDAQPSHEVAIKTFAMGMYEVTFEEYDRFAIAQGRPLPTDQGWGRGRQPATNISWQDAKDYAAWLSKETGKVYRLPSESEWEYAARSGAKQAVEVRSSNESELDEYAVPDMNAENRTTYIGAKRANRVESHDRSGNIWEWVEDCWHEDYIGAPINGSAWLEMNGGNCGRRVVRGGSWGDGQKLLRAASRNWSYAITRDFTIGFRLVQDLP